MDLSKISTEDLVALRNGDLSQVSTEGLSLLRDVLAEPAVAALPTTPKESSLIGEAKRGFQQFISGARTGAGALFGTPEEAAQAGVERGKAIEAEAGEGPSLERVTRAYRERGVLPAAGQVISDIPKLLAQQGTQIGATLGGARLGAMAGSPFGPAGALIGGGLGAVAANIPSIFGQQVERQAAEQLEANKPVDISMGRAALSTAGQAALETAGLGFTLGKTAVKKILGVADDAALAAARSKEELLQAAQATIKGGVVRGAAVEMPVEVAQSVLERWQAGLDITSPDALKEYGESMYAAGLVGGPLGGVGAVQTRGQAQRALAAQAQQEADAAAKAEADRQAALPPPTPITEQSTAELSVLLGNLRDQPASPERDQQLKEVEALLTERNKQLITDREMAGRSAFGTEGQTQPQRREKVLEEAARSINEEMIVAAGLPAKPTNNAQRALSDWFNTNVLNKTPEQLDDLVTKDPSLLEGTSLRAKILKELLIRAEPAQPRGTTGDIFTKTEAPVVEIPPSETQPIQRREEAAIEEEAAAKERAGVQAYQAMRNQFDTLQRENERLLAQYKQTTNPTDKESLRQQAQRVGESLRSLQERMKTARRTLPTQEIERAPEVEGQLGLNLEGAVQLSDLVPMGLPLEGGTPQQRSVRSWFRDNIVGAMPEDVRRLVGRKPELIKGPGLRANILRQLTQPAPAPFVETRREPTTVPKAPVSAAPVQPELDFGGTGAGVEIPSKPTPGPGAVAPTGKPTAPQPAGLAGTVPPVRGRDGGEGAPTTQLGLDFTAPTEAEKAAARAKAEAEAKAKAEAEAKAKAEAEAEAKAKAEAEAAAAEKAKKLKQAGRKWGEYADPDTQPAWKDLSDEQKERWAQAVAEGKPSIAIAEEIAPPKKPVTATEEDAVAMSWENNKPEDAPSFRALPDMYQTAYREAIADNENPQEAAARITKQVLRNRPSPLLDELAPAKEEIEAEPGVDTKRLVKMLGPKLYGEMKELPAISIKELLQNSFDAVKERLAKNKDISGKIDFVFNDNDRTIKITDNGIGMPPSIMGKEFLTIAGTKKGEDIDASGGFGVAKMVFLYGNKNLTVRSVHNGVASEMVTSGNKLIEALDGGSKPKIISNKLQKLSETEREKYSGIEDGGTEITITVPEEYRDESTGEMEPIPFDATNLSYDSALIKSPLFSDITVTSTVIRKGATRGYPLDVGIGSNFNIGDYRPFANVNFKWGTARVYVSKEEKLAFNNFHVLSNGIWQFTKTLRVSDNLRLPREFYVDISTAKNISPEDPGYPFTLNRQDLTASAKKDLAKIEDYIRVLFGQLSYSESIKDFGVVQYVGASGKVTTPVKLEPTAPPSETAFTIIKDTDKVEVKDGVLFVNGRPTPDITAEDLKSASIKIDELTVPQSDIDPNKVMIHDNVLYKGTDESFLDRARAKFGDDRVNKYLYGIGEVFQTLRDAVVSANPTDYSGLKEEAVGLSIDTKYYGVNIRIPFRGMFINPSSTRLRDNAAQIGSQLYGTMVHELAHFKVRSHNADFPAEMQKLITMLDTHSAFDAFQVKKELIQLVKDNKEIFDYMATEFGDGTNANLVPRGNRFADSSYEQVGDEGRARAMESIGGAGEQQPTVRKRTGERPASTKQIGVGAGVSRQVAPLRATNATGAQPAVTNNSLAQMQQGAYPTGGGLSQAMAQTAVSDLTKIRTIVADKIATVAESFAAKFNGAIRDELGKPSEMPLLRQAEASDQLIPAVFKLGTLVKDKATNLWQAAANPKIRPPQDLIDVVRKWGAGKNMSFQEAWAEAAKIMQSAREHEFRELNRTQAAGRYFPQSMSDTDIDRYYKMYQTDPVAKELQQIMDKVRFAMIDNLVSVGRISKTMADDWKNATAYVPFDRIDNGDMENYFRSKRRTGRGVAQLGGLPELVNSPFVERQVNNVFENYFNLMGWMTRQVVQQDATIRTLRALEDISQAKFYGKNKNAIRDANRAVKTYLNGDEVYFEVPSLYHAAAFNLRMAPLPGFFKLMGQFSQALRTAITAVPTFTAAQIPQDIQRAIMYSGVKNKAALTARVLTNFPALAKSALVGKLGDMVSELSDYGVVGDFDFRTQDPAESFMHNLGIVDRKLLGSKRFGDAIHRLSEVARASDIALRKAIYDQTMAETQGDKLLALQRAREIINFRRYGMGDKLGIIHTLTQVVPFYNAYLQGTDVLYRSLTGKDSPTGLARNAALKLFYTNTAYLTGAAVMYAMLMAGDEEYENMDLRERDRTWVIGNGFGIPVPSELGILFKALPERVLEAYRKQGTPDDIVATEAALTWFRAAFDEYLGRSVVPAAIKPLLENLTDYSFLTGRPLEGIFQKGQVPSERTTSRTSELSKTIARFTADTTGVEVSPIKIDNFLQGYLGTTAALTMAVTDQMINPNKADRPLHQLVGVGPFAYDTVGTRRATEFYDLREEVVQAQNTLNQLIKTDPSRAQTFIERNGEKLALYKSINATLNELEKTRAYRNWLDTDAAAQALSSKDRMKMKQEVQKYEQGLMEWVRQVKSATGMTRSPAKLLGV